MFEFTVVVYDDDRVTFAGTVGFDNLQDALHYAHLNMPCEIWSDGEKLNSFGFEEEE